MRFDIITVFPELFMGVLDCGIIRRAIQSRLVDIRIVNLRDFTKDRHRSVDDRPYGGGEGMVFMPGPLFDAIEFCRGHEKGSDSQVVLMTPQGKTWSQDLAAEFATIPHLMLVCGRYEGVDQRVIDSLVDREISIGDFVLTGGEIPAMVVLDSVVRLIPGASGVLGFRRQRKLFDGLIGLSAIHAARGISGADRPGGSSLGRSCEN